MVGMGPEIGPSRVPFNRRKRYQFSAIWARIVAGSNIGEPLILADSGTICTARFAVDNEAMHLTLFGMHQDRAATTAGVVGRVGADDQDRRGACVMAGAGVRYDLQGNDRIAHNNSPSLGGSALP